MAETPPDAENPRESYIRAHHDLTPAQIVGVAANRVIVEQVKGMLMLVYDIDENNAYEMLRRRARASRIKLRELAGQLSEDLKGIARDEGGNLQLKCNDLLLTAHQRITPPVVQERYEFAPGVLPEPDDRRVLAPLVEVNSPNRSLAAASVGAV